MSILKPWPEHQNPNQMRTAHAPYNFVPLPEKIIAAVDSAEDLPCHDEYDRTRHSGYFDVLLTTRSPLYIRGPVPAKDFPRQEQASLVKNQDSLVKNKPEFFHIGDEQTPVIPGSSLRGMLRGLLEIVSYGKMQWVSEKQLFFRTVGTPIGDYYRKRMSDHVETGFLYRQGDRYSIRVCSMARVRRSSILGNLYSSPSPNVIPRWERQYVPVWVRLPAKPGDANKPKIVEELSYQKRDTMIEGRLVVTGNAPNKKKEFVFLLPTDDAEKIPVSDEIINCFHDDDQLTPWQKDAFPTNQPTPGYRERDGLLGRMPTAPGDPIFFLREDGKLTFIGRAQMFRLPYTQRPIDLVPHELRQTTDIDYADALFGFVCTHQQHEKKEANVPKQGDKSRAYAGRVTVTDGRLLQPDQKDIWLAGDFDQKITPKILATPKPTAFQQYLTQQYPNDPKKLNHYDSNLSSDKTTIRGHKLYWHQGLGIDQGFTFEQIRASIKEPAPISPNDTQHTCFKPLKPGVQFSFRVHFENLSDRELGALYWTLHPQGEPGKRYCHHLGMGKPLGMGAVELHASLHIINRALRYRTLFSSDKWQLGESVAGENSSKNTQPSRGASEDLAVPELLDRATQSFEEHLLHELNPEPSCTRLADLLRIAILLKLLEWPGHKAEQGDAQRFKYMALGEYSRDRRVLPSPTLFDEPYFKGKSRPQGTQVAAQEQAHAKEDTTGSTRLSEAAEEFFVDRRLSNMNNFTQTEQGVEVRLWDRDPARTIGFIPKEQVNRTLGDKISVIVTGLHQETNGRIVIKLKLWSKR